jgi:alkanesulfonate monooxygenase SsuD/methylene tetrahydromethanopterin reductase-like flavin-dependent oxidoreductase (luciferase family)
LGGGRIERSAHVKIGIGLPTTIPGVTGQQLIDWARRADAAGFSSLGTIDRIVYSNYEPLVSLAAAAAVTERIDLTPSILIVPYRVSAAIVAKQTATLHALSGGRLVLGVAVGGREDDYEAAGASFQERGKRMDQMLDEIKRLWAGEERGYAGGVGPDVSDSPPPIVVGGQADVAFRRAARYGARWMMGGAPPEMFPEAIGKLEAAWRAEGREGEPRKIALSYFSLDDDPEAQARKTLGAYYSFLGDFADMIVSWAATGEEEVKERVRAFRETGCDELIMIPSSTDPEQVDRLAAAVM